MLLLGAVLADHKSAFHCHLCRVIHKQPAPELTTIDMILKQAGKLIGVISWTISCLTLFAADVPSASNTQAVQSTNAARAAGNRLQPARLNPDQLPISKIGSFTPQSAQRKTNGTVRIQGVVLNQGLGEYVTIQDNTGSIRAETRQTTPIPPGERAIVWGRLSWNGNNVLLRNASIRPLAWDSIAEQKITPAPGKPDRLPMLTQVIQIRSLPTTQAAWKYPVRVRGVVTSLWKDYKGLFVQDDTAGIYVAAANINLDTNWDVGDEVELDGVSGPGGYAPIIEAETAKVLGREDLPAARRINLYQMAMGQFDSQWVEVRGVVRSVQINRRSTDLELSDVKGLLEVDVPGGEALTNLVDSLVRIQGVCCSRANPNRQLTGTYIWSPSPDSLVVEEKGVADPFTLSAQPIASLSEFTQSRATQHRIKVAGTVTFSQPGRPLFVQDETGGVPIYLANAVDCTPGDRVEVAGYLSLGDFGFVFRDASCRVMGHPGIRPAKPVFWLNPLNPNLHGTWVQLKARLISSGRRGNDEVLTLQTEDTVFEALRPIGIKTETDSFPPPDSLVQLRGVYSILGDESRMPRSMRLYVPSTEPIQVLERPSWLNARRAGSVLVGMVIVVVAAALWAITLRRRVQTQTLVIRERLEKEASLEQRYREIFDGANDLIFTLNLDGRLISLNPAGQRILGYTGQEIHQLNINQILASGSQKLSDKLLEMNATDGNMATCDCEFIPKNGQRLEVEVSLRLVLKDGKPDSVQAIARDITHRKRAEEELFNSRQMLRWVLDTIPQRVFWKDRNLVYVGCNKSIAQDSGYADPNEILGKTDYEMGWAASADQYRADDRHIMDTDQPKLNYEELQVKSDGSQTWLRTSKVPLHDKDGGVIGVLGTYEDITERKRAEAELAAASSLLEMLLENSPDCIYFKDKQSRFVRYSNAFEKLFKVAESESLRGKTDFDFFTEEHARPAFEDEQEIIRSGKPLIGKLERETHPDGRVTWGLTTKMPWRDKDGNIIGTFGISKDVTAIKEAEAELAYERELFHTLLETLPDSIYFKDRDSRFVRVSKSKAAMTLQSVRSRLPADRPPESMEPLPAHLSSVDAFASYLIGRTDFDTFEEPFARAAFEEEQNILRTGQPIIGQIENQVYPGKWMFVTKMPWRDRDGNLIGTFGISRDITALKEAETKLEAVHQRLMETSRLAGMAEVATDVLHNVGNVLNSVNVSCTLTLDRVKSSKISSLVKVSSLLKENSGRLEEFLTRDPRGRQIPEFLAVLSEHLEGEQTSLLTELEHLVKHIDHIKQIVAMQQTYAKVVGVLETVNPTQLVEDALHINAAALLRHDVHVRREFADTPQIVTEKHKVLQILVNLIRNAKYAMDDAKRADKVLTIKVDSQGANEIRIRVIDNGVGIPRENLTRIFSHGFTTRRNGHGFGLHSSALTVRELGGSIQAHSDGPGQGAIFTLVLPCAPPEPSKESA